MKKCCKKWRDLYYQVIRHYPSLKEKINFCPDCKNSFEKWINSCPKNVPSIEEIRKITAKIPYSMAKAHLGELEEEMKECCKRYAEQYTVDGDKRHYLFNYCPHCRAKLHPNADKQAKKELQELEK